MLKSKLFFSFILVVLFTSNFARSLHAQDNVSMNDLMFDDQYYDVLDKAMANKADVKYMDIAMQKLKSFPVSICTLPNVERLSLGFNYISSLPAAIGKMEKLQYIDISGMHNGIFIPKELAQLKNLREFKMEDMLNKEEEKKIVDRVTELLPECKIVTGHTK